MRRPLEPRYFFFPPSRVFTLLSNYRRSSPRLNRGIFNRLRSIAMGKGYGVRATPHPLLTIVPSDRVAVIVDGL